MDKPLSPNDIAKILRGFAKDLAQANALLIGTLLTETPNPDKVLARLKLMADVPELRQNPIAHDFLHYVLAELAPRPEAH